METATSTSGTNGTDEATKKEQNERERNEDEQSKIKFKRKSKLKSYRQGWEQSFLRRSAISVAILVSNLWVLFTFHWLGICLWDRNLPLIKATHTGGTKAYRCGHVYSPFMTGMLLHFFVLFMYCVLILMYYTCRGAVWFLHRFFHSHRWLV